MSMEPELVVAFLEELPKCDFDALHGEAHYDAKTNLGPWAYLCEACFKKYCPGQLGTGVGQRLMLKPPVDEEFA